MKINVKKAAVIAIIVCIVVLCAAILFRGSKYYELDDFDSIIIGESMLSDVYSVAPNNWLVVTSYGGYVEYPMEDGCRIIVEFYGPDKVVGDIRIAE